MHAVLESPVACAAQGKYASKSPAIGLANSSSLHGGMTFNALAVTCQGLISGAAHTLIAHSTAQNNVTFAALGEQIPIAWAAGDLPQFTPASAALLQIALLPLQTSTTESGTITTQTSTTASTSGLSTGTKIGTGVGIACGVLLLVAAIVYVFYKRSRKARKMAEPSQAMSELQGPGVERRAELTNDSQIQEIGGRKILAEADHASVRYELEGAWHGHEAHGPRSPL
jgi:hypothetical protein